MAPRRILEFTLKHSGLLFLCIVFLMGVLISSCGTTRDATDDPGEAPGVTETTDDAAADAASEAFIAMLDKNRSNLSDVLASQESEVPDLFLKESEARDIGDPHQGYRIQILSTQNVERADSVANDFRFWADSTMTNYTPKTYVLFRQPYYKVHIGNFHFREQAMKLSKYIKDRYPEAWVVPDEVEPNLVPADTISFSDQKKDSVAIK